MPRPKLTEVGPGAEKSNHASLGTLRRLLLNTEHTVYLRIHADGVQKISVLQISLLCFSPGVWGFHSSSLFSVVTSVSVFLQRHLGHLVVCNKFLAGLLASTVLGSVTRLLF